MSGSPSVASEVTAPSVTGKANGTAALVTLCIFLLIEPMIRGLAWWPLAKFGPSRFLYDDVVWLACAVMVASIGLTSQIAAGIVRHRWLVALAAIWGAGMVGSSVLAAAPYIAIGRCLDWVLLLIFGLYLHETLRTRPEFSERVLKSLTLGTLAYMAGAVLLLIAVDTGPNFNWVGQFPGVSNVRHFGFEVMAVALVASLFRKPSMSRPFVWFLRVAACAGWALLFWTGSRGTLLASLCALIAVFGLTKTRLSNPRVREIGGLIVVGFALALLHTPPITQPGGSSFGALRTIGWVNHSNINDIDDISSGRIAMWKETVHTIASNPLFGIGEGQMRTTLKTAQGYYSQPHNIVLQALLFWGLVGGVPFLIGVAYGLLRACRRVLSQGALDSAATAGLAVALGLAANSMLDSSLFHARPVAHFLIGLAIALTACPGSRSVAPPRGQRINAPELA